MYSGATTVSKYISIPVTAFVFILRGTQLVFGDGIVLYFEIERVMGFWSEKFEDKVLPQTVVYSLLWYGTGKSCGEEGIFNFEER